ncbi:unnamed protein product, partial [Mesorhabditis belari]|uniref:Uncharacterized protein n=1 Tax=Mesorhabditis belari TaxID=2138241 RepID=A0AAF3J4D1_9BILA
MSASSSWTSWIPSLSSLFSWVTVGAAVYAGYKLELHKVRYEITYLNGVEISRTVTRGKEILYTFGK